MFPAAGGGYAKPPGVSTWFSGALDRCVTAAEAARTVEAVADAHDARLSEMVFAPNAAKLQPNTAGQAG